MCAHINSMNRGVHFKGIKVDYLISTPCICPTTRINSYAMTCSCTNNHQSSTLALQITIRHIPTAGYIPILSHLAFTYRIYSKIPTFFSNSPQNDYKDTFFSCTMIEYQQSILPSFIGRFMIIQSTPHVFDISKLFLSRYEYMLEEITRSFPQVQNYQKFTVHVEME